MGLYRLLVNIFLYFYCEGVLGESGVNGFLDRGRPFFV
jgi:hypothetical protein